VSLNRVLNVTGVWPVSISFELAGVSDSSKKSTPKLLDRIVELTTYWRSGCEGDHQCQKQRNVRRERGGVKTLNLSY